MKIYDQPVLSAESYLWMLKSGYWIQNLIDSCVQVQPIAPSLMKTAP